MAADDGANGAHEATEDEPYEPATIEERTEIGKPLIGIPSGTG